MKKGILLLGVIIAVQVNAQSLKEALYGGKLKTDTGSVLRKGEDLSTKIDSTRQKKPIEPEKSKPVAVATDPSKTTALTDSSAMAPAIPVDNAVTTKDNNKLWKEFVDATISVLNTEVVTSKKIKKGDYFVIVDYVIEVDGRVNITSVLPTPESKFLEEQVKERLSIDTPKLNPVLGSNGKARKVNKRYSFTVTSK